jgi:ribonuclease P protein component
VPNRVKPALHGFGPDRRLARRADFERLLTQGRRRHIGGYTFFVQQREKGPPRLGILISRKHAAKATERNGIKRCIREAFRLEQRRLDGIDMLVRPPQGVRASAAMLARVRELLCALAS